MKTNEVIASSFMREWIAHELKQFGVEPRAVYRAEYTDERARFLVAADEGVVELVKTLNTPPANATAYTGRIHPWRSLAVTVETASTFEPGWTSRLHLAIPALKLDVTGPEPEDDGMEDFARECLKLAGAGK